MPVDTLFLKKVLEDCMGHSVEISMMFDFLEDVVTTSPLHKESLSNFMEKWRACLAKSSQRMMIVNYVGTWSPNCSTQKELDKQEKWSDFACKFDPSFTHCTIDSQSSPDYQPLNFKELLRLTFWKEIYEQFGRKIVEYVFNKCALLFEVDEGLYLIVGYRKGSICTKFANYDRRFQKKGATSSCTQENNKNPYSFQLNKREENVVELVAEKESSETLQNCKQDVRRTSAIKRCNDNPGAGVNDIKEPQAKRIKYQDEKADSIPLHRWILPKPDVLKKLIEYRNSTLRAYNLIPSTTATTWMKESTPNHILNYICIQRDAIFKMKDKCLVMKQKADFQANQPKLPRDWNGLKLPDNLNSIADNNGRIQVQVYIISETLAKELEIRIKPKGRQRKKVSRDVLPAVASSSDLALPQNSSKPEEGKPAFTLTEQRLANLQNIANGNNSSEHIGASGPDKTQSLKQNQSLKPTVIPYPLSFTLPISSCLYNKSSWSKFPAHCLSTAVSKLNQDDRVESIRIVIDDILNLPVGSQSAHCLMLESIQGRWEIGDESISLNKIIMDIIQSHSKFKDLHKLFKNCVYYWRSKYIRKQEKKRKSTPDPGPLVVSAEVHEAATLGKGETKDKTCNVRRNTDGTDIEKPEVIDLTLTQSTSIKQLPCPSGKSLQLTGKVTQRTKYDLLRKCSGNSFKKRTFKRLKHPVPANCVMQSLKQIFHIMKVDQLLGSKRNIRGFFKFVRKAVILGGTKSALHLSQLMAMVHAGDIPLVKITTCEQAVETFTAKLVTWLFNKYVLVLLKMSFYVTECNTSRGHVRFYLRESWTSASRKMTTHLAERGSLDMLKNNETSPNAVLRYVPKQNLSLRSLLAMKKSARCLTKEESKTVNVYLHHLDSKVNKSRMNLPTTLQHKWRKFLSEWKANGSPKLYYIRMDIRDAFPSVSLKKLSEILLATGGERGHKILIKQYALRGSNGVKRIRKSLVDERSRHNWHSGIHVRPCIAMDIENDEEINVWKILDRINTVINTKNIVRVGKGTFRFHYGLPQGWSQSPILCSIYYGYMDSTLYLPYLESNGRLFLRIVDDYLFLSPNPAEIASLIQLMKMGCEKYGIQMNEEKSDSNIFVRSDILQPSSSCELVTFCGWNFCVTCGHVSRDFKKYVGQDFCSTITFQMQPHMTSPEEFIRHRGTVIIPARVKPILLDPIINCSRRILLTAFEASIMLGFRFYAICRVIYPNLNALKEEERVKQLISSINLCCTRLARFIARNAKYHGPTFSSQSKVSCGKNCCGIQNEIQIDHKTLPNSTTSSNDTSSVDYISDALLSVDSLKYTALYGFRLKLANHSAVFNKILPYLNSSLSKLSRKLGDTHCDHIVKVVGSKIPNCFSEILI